MDEKKVREVIEDFKEIVLMSSAMGFDITSGQCDLIIEALEKQLPKKPNFEGDGYAPNGTFVYDTWECPNCEECYEVDYDDYDYCPKCGQKIDWSE